MQQMKSFKELRIKLRTHAPSIHQLFNHRFTDEQPPNLALHLLFFSFHLPLPSLILPLHPPLLLLLILILIHRLLLSPLRHPHKNLRFLRPPQPRIRLPGMPLMVRGASTVTRGDGDADVGETVEAWKTWSSEEYGEGA